MARSFHHLLLLLLVFVSSLCLGGKSKKTHKHKDRRRKTGGGEKGQDYQEDLDDIYQDHIYDDYEDESNIASKKLVSFSNEAKLSDIKLDPFTNIQITIIVVQFPTLSKSNQTPLSQVDGFRGCGCDGVCKDGKSIPSLLCSQIV